MIIPLYRKITLRTFPYCTLCLVLINVAVFLLFQRNDDLYHEMAIEYYVESGLLDMEICMVRVIVMRPVSSASARSSIVRPSINPRLPMKVL